MLADSIARNVDKGSPIGLAFNRRAFAALQNAARQEHGPGASKLEGTLREVENRLAQAESIFGQLNRTT